MTPLTETRSPTENKRPREMETESLILLATAIILGVGLFSQRSQAKAATRQAEAMEEQVEVLRQQLRAEEEKPSPLALLYQNNLGHGRTEYQFSDGRLVTAYRTMGDGVMYLANGEQVRADDPTYGRTSRSSKTYEAPGRPNPTNLRGG